VSIIVIIKYPIALIFIASNIKRLILGYSWTCARDNKNSSAHSDYNR